MEPAKLDYCSPIPSRTSKQVQSGRSAIVGITAIWFLLNLIVCSAASSEADPFAAIGWVHIVGPASNVIFLFVALACTDVVRRRAGKEGVKWYVLISIGLPMVSYFGMQAAVSLMRR